MLGFFASQITVEEDVNRLLPDSGQTKQIADIFKSSNFADKVIVKILARGQTQPEALITLADSFEAKLLEKHSAEIASIKKTVSDETALNIYNTVHNNLPVYLQEEDYSKIDSLITPKSVAQTMPSNCLANQQWRDLHTCQMAFSLKLIFLMLVNPYAHLTSQKK